MQISCLRTYLLAQLEDRSLTVLLQLSFYGVTRFIGKYRGYQAYGRYSQLYRSAPDRKAEHCDERVCLSVSLCVFVCQRSIISSELHVRSSPKLSCLLPMSVTQPWRRSDTLCTSDFMDDVIFACKPRLLDVARR